MNDKQYTYGFASQLLRSGRKAQHDAQATQGDEDLCGGAEAEGDAENCVPDEDAGSSTSNESNQVGHESISVKGLLCVAP